MLTDIPVERDSFPKYLKGIERAKVHIFVFTDLVVNPFASTLEPDPVELIPIKDSSMSDQASE